jgi:hypothetical protein
MIDFPLSWRDDVDCFHRTLSSHKWDEVRQSGITLDQIGQWKYTDKG